MRQPSIELTDRAIDHVCARMAAFLKEKNHAYGNSALDPVRIFSRADPVEQIKVRIDDKLSRLARGSSFPGDNDVKDTSGYLILWQAFEAIENGEVT